MILFCIIQIFKKLAYNPNPFKRKIKKVLEQLAFYWFPKIIGNPESPEPITITLLFGD